MDYDYYKSDNMFFTNCKYKHYRGTKINHNKPNFRPIGENIIKGDAILSAWQKYCRESRVYRILEFFGLR